MASENRDDINRSHSIDRTPGITGAVKVEFRQIKSGRHTASRACVGSPTTLGAGVSRLELAFIVALASRHVNNIQPRRENAVVIRIRPKGRTNCRDDSANAQRNHDLCLQGSGRGRALRSGHESRNAAQPQASDKRRRSETPGMGQHLVFRRTSPITGDGRETCKQTKKRSTRPPVDGMVTHLRLH